MMNEHLLGYWGDPTESNFETICRLANALGVEAPSREEWEEWPDEAQELVVDALAERGLGIDWEDGECWVTTIEWGGYDTP